VTLVEGASAGSLPMKACGTSPLAGRSVQAIRSPTKENE
jgi:hypothetical protein